MKKTLWSMCAASVLLSAASFAAEVTVNSDITTDTTWTSDNVYLLDGKVKVKNGATLTIEPGTNVYGASTAYLVITADSMINAAGSATNPITFSSEEAYLGLPEGRAQWGGLTILGNAQVNDHAQQYYEVDAADPDFAFGTDTTANNADSSGVLTHVIINNSGYAVEPDKEVNGLSLCGVGSGTIISDISVTNSGDDGVELWGGTVNLNNISITNAGDDSFDVDNGYQGTVNNLTIVQDEATAALVEMSTGGDASIFRTKVKVNGFSFTSSANQTKEGGIYFKDAEVGGVFMSGNIDHNGVEGVLHSAAAMSAGALDDIQFINVTNSGTTTTVATGSGATELAAEYASQPTETIIDADITANTTWTADTVYELDGKVKVKNGATLTIEPGTLVYGNSTAYLVVTADASIDAAGTQSSPIIFTSADNYLGLPTGRAQWGGVTVLGNAQVNDHAQQYYEVDAADPDFAFGTDTTANNAESSGTLTHLHILNSGYAVEPDKEVNGLSLCGIGSGTTISNINVVSSGDDGIELWGGVVDLSNITILNAGDDSFDVDNGYQGTVTNIAIAQDEATAALVEMSTGGDASIFRTKPTVNGFYFTSSENQTKEGGIYFKDGETAAVYSNGVVTHNGVEGVLHSAATMSSGAKAATSFSSVDNAGPNTTIGSGPAATDLEALWNGQTFSDSNSAALPAIFYILQ